MTVPFPIPGHRRTVAIAFCIVFNACITSSLAAMLPVVLTVDFGASYVAASALIVAGTLASTVAIHVLGKMGDRVQSRYSVAILSSVCGLAGALALSQVASYWGVLLVFSTLLAVAGSLFPQLLAVAFVHKPSFAAQARALASAGWVVGPPLGGAIVSLRSTEVLGLSIAGGYAILTICLLLMYAGGGTSTAGTWEPIRPPHRRPKAHVSNAAVIAVLAALHFMMAVSALGIPWRIIEIGGSGFHVGLAFAIAAGVEIPLIAGADRLRRRAGPAAIITGASCVLALYFLAMALAQSVVCILLACVANGVVTGVMMGLSLIILQERMPDRPGSASALYSNILRLSYIGALLAAGALAQWVSIVAIFWAATAMALATSFILVVLRPFDFENKAP